MCPVATDSDSTALDTEHWPSNPLGCSLTSSTDPVPFPDSTHGRWLPLHPFQHCHRTGNPDIYRYSPGATGVLMGV